MSTVVADPTRQGPPPLRPPGGGRLSTASAVRTVVGMELRQRLRSRGWYVLLGVFFLVVGAVTLGALGLRATTLNDLQSQGMDPAAAEVQLRSAGQWLFDGVLLFVLTLSLLVSPVLAANAISGDRAGGTLAITQVTLLRTGQLMAGKWIAAWIASAAFLVAALPWLAVAAVVGRVSPLFVLVGLLMILVEFGVITGIGVAVSAIAGRTLFAVVVTYLIVAALSIGTIVAFVLSLQFLQTDVRANMPEHDGMLSSDPLEGQDVENMTQAEIDAAWAEWERQNPDAYDGIADACVGPVGVQSVPDPRRVGWLLAANPYAVLADASPWDPTGAAMQFTPDTGPLNMMSAALRLTQQDPAETTECLDGQLRRIDTTSVPDREGTWPVWPLGLAMQAALTGGLLWWGHRRLDTPAGRLPAGTRVA
ncbi:ABC transporter permease [Micrococcus endophyticus]|uniref:ABC transporter permease n=1 Tax=Micrococcus endophyticus TaxID=455343 RepID=UPI0034CD7576